MKCIYSLFVAFFICASSFAQTSNFYSSIGGTFDDEIKNIILLPDGGHITSGTFQTVADLDPTPLVFNATSSGQSDIFISRFAANGDLTWSIQIGGTLQDDITDMVIENNTLYVIGTFDSTVDFDPSSNNSSLTSLGVQDGFLAAYNLDGQFQWVQHIGGASGDIVNCMTIAQDGKIVLGINSYSSPLNFNTSGSATHSNTTGQDFIIAVYNGDGTYHSNVAISNNSSNGYGSINGLVTDENGAIYATGFVGDPGYDFNPNSEPNVVFVTNSGNAFIVKYNTDFSLSWLKTFGSFGYDTGNDIAIFENSKVLVTGLFSGTVIIDEALPALEGNTGDAGFIAELNTDGDFQFAGAMAGDGSVSPTSLHIISNGQYYISGRYSNTFDADPTAGIATSPASSTFSNSGFVMKLTANNELVWMERVGFGGEHYLYDIAINDSQEVYVVGSFNFTSNFGIGEGSASLTSAGSLDGYLLSISQDLCSDFLVTAINLENATCASIGQINLELTGGSAPYSVNWENGEVINQNDYIFLTQGIYNVFISDVNGCTRTRTWVMDGPQSDTGNDVIITTHHSDFAVGQTTTIHVDVYNQLCAPASGEIKVAFPVGLVFVETNAIGYTIEDNIITVPFENIDYDSEHIKFFIWVYMPFGVYEIGDEVNYTTEVILDDTSNNQEQNFNNNSAAITAIAVSAFDPNDKQVYPRGACEQGYILQPEYLTYTIRFQNTGNIAAQNIYLYDTLSTHLDPQSVIIRSFSPFYPEVEILENNILKFTYANVYLPDSTSNPEESIGWVTFEISPSNSALPSGTEITNKAGIIFDANPAIITNTVINTVVDEIPSVNLAVINQVGTISAVQDGVSYQWFDCTTSTPLEGLTSQTVSPEIDGNYAVEMALPGCPAVQSDCYDYIYTSVEELASHQFFNVYPNPSNGEIQLNLSNDLEDAILHIYNNIGQEINQIDLRNTANSKLSINLPSGVYQFVLTKKGVVVGSARVVRE
jgi:uncharacterized repeat protein (TIGR01451 family)